LEKYSLVGAGLINMSGLYFSNISALSGLDEVFLVISFAGNTIFFVVFGLIFA